MGLEGSRKSCRRRATAHGGVAVATVAMVATASASSALAPMVYRMDNARLVQTRGHAGVVQSTPSAFTVAPVTAVSSAWWPFSGWRRKVLAAVGVTSSALLAITCARKRRSHGVSRCAGGPATGSVAEGVDTALALGIEEPRIPEDYRAAGVLFYTVGQRNSEGHGEVSSVLLGLEERKVSLRDLGCGSGSAKRRVLLFPQGKREACDADSFVATARREFVEETGDPAGALAQHLDRWEDAAGQPPPAWFGAAKMAVCFCEVPPADASACAEAAASSFDDSLPMRPVWVEAADLRQALAAASPSTEVRTDAGHFPLFPMTRRFLRGDRSMRWLGMAPRSRRGR